MRGLFFILIVRNIACPNVFMFGQILFCYSLLMIAYNVFAYAQNAGYFFFPILGGQLSPGYPVA